MQTNRSRLNAFAAKLKEENSARKNMQKGQILPSFLLQTNHIKKDTVQWSSTSWTHRLNKWHRDNTRGGPCALKSCCMPPGSGPGHPDPTLHLPNPAPGN